MQWKREARSLTVTSKHNSNRIQRRFPLIQTNEPNNGILSVSDIRFQRLDRDSKESFIDLHLKTGYWARKNPYIKVSKYIFLQPWSPQVPLPGPLLLHFVHPI